MELAAFVVQAVLVEGRSVREVARAHGVSKTWLYELVARYRAESTWPTVIGCPRQSVTNAVTTELSSRSSSSGEARPPRLT